MQEELKQDAQLRKDHDIEVDSDEDFMIGHEPFQ